MAPSELTPMARAQMHAARLLSPITLAPAAAMPLGSGLAPTATQGVDAGGVAGASQGAVASWVSAWGGGSMGRGVAAGQADGTASADTVQQWGSRAGHGWVLSPAASGEDATSGVVLGGWECDVYALGVMIGELVTGRKPWAGKRVHEIMWAITHLHLQPYPPDSLPAHPAGLAPLVARCCDKAASQRPTAAEAAAALEVLLYEAGEGQVLAL